MKLFSSFLLLAVAAYVLYIVGNGRTIGRQLPDSPGKEKVKWFQRIFLTLGLLLIIQAIWNLWQVFKLR